MNEKIDVEINLGGYGEEDDEDDNLANASAQPTA